MSTPIASVATPLFIGCVSGNNTTSGQACESSPFKGDIDEVGLWARPLTLLEIQAQYRGNPLLREDGKGDACDACPASTVASCAPTTCLDRDGDGYGVPGASACSAGQPAAFDCNDARRDVHPGAVEACDSVDNDCDGVVDDSCLSSPKVTRYTYNGFNQLLTSGTPVTCAAGDADCDGVADAADNCPAAFNPGQEDSDRVTLDHTSPAGLWRFEDAPGATTVADTTGRNAGTLVGGATLVPGRNGKALSLNGFSGSVDLPGTVTSNTNSGISVEAWVNSQATTASYYRSIVSEVYGADGNIEFGLFTQGATHQLSGTFLAGAWPRLDAGPLPQNQWVHVAGTYDGSRIRLYQDGVKVAESSPIGSPLPQGTAGWQIGNGITGQRWQGLIDDVAIYERALSDTEVALHKDGYGGDGLGDACDPCAGNPDGACHAATCTDADGDGYGPRGADNCGANVGKFDCDDGNAAVRPGAAEVAGDSLDNNCDGVTDGVMAAARLFSWDGNGNQTKKAEPTGTTTFTWDARDRLAAVAGPGGSATYGYDTSDTRTYLRDSRGEARVLREGINEIKQYVLGVGPGVRNDYDPTRIDALLGQHDSAGTFLVRDALGSVVGILGSSGDRRASYSYDAYGDRVAAQDGVPGDLGFAGRPRDGATIYFRKRHYDPSVGLWLSPDPLGPFADAHGGEHEPVAKSLYRYVGNNPVRFNDPLGLFMASEHTDLTMIAGISLQLPVWMLEQIATSNNAVDGDQANGWKHYMKSGPRMTDIPNLFGLGANWLLEGARRSAAILYRRYRQDRDRGRGGRQGPAMDRRQQGKCQERDLRRQRWKSCQRIYWELPAYASRSSGTQES